jgi:hypothetical protein
MFDKENVTITSFGVVKLFPTHTSPHLRIERGE